MKRDVSLTVMMLNIADDRKPTNPTKVTLRVKMVA